MSVVGTVESLWRYPVKSMRGEELAEVFVSSGGLANDRLYAFRSSAARPDFPYFTARQQPDMLRYRALIGPNESSLEVETPDGQRFAIDDPKLIEVLREGVDPKHEVSLMQSERPLTDAAHVSLISLQTVAALAQESGTPPEKRRYRASIYLDLADAAPFAEDGFVGHLLRIGRDLVVQIDKRDARCMVINLDPDTAAMEPSVLKTVAQAHGGACGIYGSVRQEGTVRRGDPVELLD